MPKPPYIKSPDEIRVAYDAWIKRVDAPGYVVTERDAAEFATLHKQYRDYLKWLQKNGVPHD